MTNASCADCGRIVAFRTEDPTEIAECRNCGVWVKRTEEMPGVAVKIHDQPQHSKAPQPTDPGELAVPVKSETISAKGLFEAIRELRSAVTSLQEGQEVLLSRTLPVTEMPAPDEAISEEEPEEKPPREVPRGFFTTRFSSLQIPLIPASLEDLKVDRRITADEIAVPPIPAEDRSDRAQLLAEPLQSEPEPWVENSPAAATVLPEDDAASPPAAEPEPLETENPPPFAETIEDEADPLEADPFFEPDEQPPPLPLENTPQVAASAASPQPFLSAEEVLAKKIAEAKSAQPGNPTGKEKSEVWGADEKPGKGVFITIALVLLAIFAGGIYAWKETDLFGSIKADSAENSALNSEKAEPPLLKLPRYGVEIPDSDSRVLEARKVARKFADAQSIDAVMPLIQPVNRELLTHFYEPMVGPTLELYQARQLNKNRLEFDFLVKDYGRPERLLPVVKIGEGPYLVDWKIFAECEELTLLSLTQGTLILDNGEEVDSGAIRAWVEEGKRESMDFPVGGVKGFLLHDITEQAIASAYASEGSSALQKLTEALATTAIRYKGRPAIRTILEVERIVEADPESDSPAKLGIKDVIATDWRADTLPETPESSPEPTPEPAPSGDETESPVDPEFPDSPLPPVDGLPE